MTAICIIGLIVALWRGKYETLVFFGIASAWLALSELVPAEAYFHSGAMVATLIITILSFMPSKLSERLVYCCLACIGVTALDFASFSYGWEIYSYNPALYAAIYGYAIADTALSNGDKNGLYFFWRGIVSGNYVSRYRGDHEC